MRDKVRTWVTKVYGPYTRKDGRQHVVLYNGHKRQTVSYPKWLMEQQLGRELREDETVDHKNRDFTDNRLENLQILSRTDHAALDTRRVRKIEVTCVYCGNKALKSPSKLDGNAKQGKAGPFCGKKCAGTYSASVHHERQERLKPQKRRPINGRDYYLKDKN